MGETGQETDRQIDRSCQTYTACLMVSQTKLMDFGGITVVRNNVRVRGIKKQGVAGKCGVPNDPGDLGRV